MSDLTAREEVQAKIMAMEEQMRTMPQLPIKTTHTFCNGIYAREIFIPKGAILTGMIHLTENLNIVAQGDISVWTDEGVRRVTAPCTIVSSPGAKRVGYAHEDTVWITLHATPLTDLAQIEQDFVTNDFADPRLLKFQKQKTLQEERPWPGLPLLPSADL